jgi:hypothetical protein
MYRAQACPGNVISREDVEVSSYYQAPDDLPSSGSIALLISKEKQLILNLRVKRKVLLQTERRSWRLIYPYNARGSSAHYGKIYSYLSENTLSNQITNSTEQSPS